MNKTKMKEEFLHYVWQHRHYDFLGASTTDGKSLEVIFPGYHNQDAGPDFLQAVIVLGGIHWVGSVEIHCRSSDWLRHKHQCDDKYKAVILHVVYEYDCDIFLSDNEVVPTLELKDKIPRDMFIRYDTLMSVPDMLLCRYHLPKVDSLIVQHQLSSVLMERLLRRQSELQQLLNACRQDWNELIYRSLAKGFGCKKNVTAFELLTQSLPYCIIRSHLSSRLQTYALLLGQSGLLDVSGKDEYGEKLLYEYSYLRHKYRLDPIGAHQWNWLRLRPQNFPTLRIAQFAQLLFETGNMLQANVLKSPEIVLRQWMSVAPDDYWNDHYQFGKTTAWHASGVGMATMDSLIINTIVPIRFAYAKFMGDDAMQEEALSLLEKVNYEENGTTRIFQNSVFPRKSAYESQAQIELMSQYCSPKRCLNCAIGERIVRDILGRPPNG